MTVTTSISAKWACVLHCRTLNIRLVWKFFAASPLYSTASDFFFSCKAAAVLQRAMVPRVNFPGYALIRNVPASVPNGAFPKSEREDDCAPRFTYILCGPRDHLQDRVSVYDYYSPFTDAALHRTGATVSGKMSWSRSEVTTCLALRCEEKP